MVAPAEDEGRVRRVERCALEAVDEPWAYASEHAAAIDAHWARRSGASPGLFNGRIFLLRRLRLEGACLTAAFSAVEFKSFLHWRESGYPACGVRDGFGSALIRSAEGHVLLGRQSEGNINAGLAYLPGGFIDARDVGADGRIDIEAAIARELAEETGLDASELTRSPGYLVTLCGPLVSIAIEFRARQSAPALRGRMLTAIARHGDGELADIVVIRSAQEADPAQVPPYARALLDHVLGR